MVPGNRHSFRIETRGNSVEPIRPIHVVLDIFLAGPDDLDRAVDMLRDPDRAFDTIALQPPAEAAADQMIVERDLLQREARDLRRRRLAACNRLVADPDFAGVL